MESPDSTLSRRTISFNPEAAAFNPVFSSPIQQDIEDGPLAAPTPPEAFKSISMVPMFNCECFWSISDITISNTQAPDSPFQGSVSRYSPYHGGQLTPAPVRLEDFLSPDAQALVNKLEGKRSSDCCHHYADNCRAPRSARDLLTPYANTKIYTGCAHCCRSNSPSSFIQIPIATTSTRVQRRGYQRTECWPWTSSAASRQQRGCISSRISNVSTFAGASWGALR